MTNQNGAKPGAHDQNGYSHNGLVETLVGIRPRGEPSPNVVPKKPTDHPDIIWPEDVVTASFPKRLQKITIKLVNGRQRLTWSPTNTRDKLVIGRSTASNIIINNDLVSRIHAYITILERGCIYFDQSRNGSFVIVRGVLSKLNKSGIPIEGTGTIYIGSSPLAGAVDPSLIIEYTISIE